MNKKSKLLNLILPLITVLCILVIWSVASYSIGSEYILPSVKDTLDALILLLAEQSFYVAFFLTLLRSVIAFVLSFIFFSRSMSRKIRSDLV